MGRAQNAGQAIAVGGFDTLMGARRGSAPLDLSAMRPSAEAVAFAKRLAERAGGGDLAEALSELVRVAVRVAPAKALLGRPLPRELADGICAGAALRALLSEDERAGLLERLGLTAAQLEVDYVAMASIKGQRLAGVQLARCLERGDSDPELIITAARELELGTFAGAVAQRAWRSGADSLMSVFAPAEISDLASLSGHPDLATDTVAAARHLSVLLTQQDWRESVRSALGSPPLALADLLRTKLVLAAPFTDDE